MCLYRVKISATVARFSFLGRIRIAGDYSAGDQQSGGPQTLPSHCWPRGSVGNLIYQTSGFSTRYVSARSQTWRCALPPPPLLHRFRVMSTFVKTSALVKDRERVNKASLMVILRGSHARHAIQYTVSLFIKKKCYTLMPDMLSVATPPPLLF